MDFELLNFWIRSLRFNIVHKDITLEPCLCISLKAHKHDMLYSHSIPLSRNKNAILEFFGYDTSVKYENLTEKNLFEYLCTTNKFQHSLVKYCSFKGPHAKNKQHERFDRYLREKFKGLQKNDKFEQRHNIVTFMNDAISYFGKEKEFADYVEKKDILSKVMNKMYSRNLEHDNFKSFILVYGIIGISKMTEDAFNETWNDFVSHNWSGANSLL